MNEIHNRRSPRLKKFDYATDGAYFVTTCIQDRENFFGKIKDEKMILNASGKIVKQKWLWLAKQYPYVVLDKFVVMPNHFHGILFIDSVFCRGGSRPAPTPTVKIKPLPELIGAFKTISSKQIHQSVRPDFQWQRSFHDRIIRDDDELNRIRDYIQLNPKNRNDDKNFYH